MFFKLTLIKNLASFTEKHLCWNLFLIGCRPKAGNFIKKRLRCRHFPVKFAKFLGTPFFTEHLQCLLLFHWNFWYSYFSKHHWKLTSSQLCIFSFAYNMDTTYLKSFKSFNASNYSNQLSFLPQNILWYLTETDTTRLWT